MDVTKLIKTPRKVIFNIELSTKKYWLAIDNKIIILTITRREWLSISLNSSSPLQCFLQENTICLPCPIWQEEKNHRTAEVTFGARNTITLSKSPDFRGCLHDNWSPQAYFSF